MYKFRLAKESNHFESIIVTAPPCTDRMRQYSRQHSTLSSPMCDLSNSPSPLSISATSVAPSPNRAPPKGTRVNALCQRNILLFLAEIYRWDDVKPLSRGKRISCHLCQPEEPFPRCKEPRQSVSRDLRAKVSK